MDCKHRINSEIKIENQTFNITVGTMDKKHPNVIYFDLNGYIIPTGDTENYTDTLSVVEKGLRKEIGNTIKNNGNLSENFICVFDVANKRVKKDKKSYFSLSFFVTLLNTGEKCFKDVSDQMENIFSDSFNNFISIFNDYGFSLKKSKSESVSFDYL